MRRISLAEEVVGRLVFLAVYVPFAVAGAVADWIRKRRQ